MLKTIPKELWAFDVEWVPDVASGRRVYGLADITPDEAVLQTMWEHGGADEDDPRPYLKTVMCRVVSIAAVIRRQADDGRVALDLRSLPNGDVRTIVQYNECDALTTYLLWLRAALLAGHLTPEQHAHEEELLEALLRTRGAQDDHEHLLEYVERWHELRAVTAATFLASAT